MNTAAAPIVFAFDPGLTTGWASYTENEGFLSGQVEGRMQFYGLFDSVVELGRPMHVIGERFTITPQTARKSPQLDPLYILGHLEAVCYKLGHTFKTQLPSDAMSFATDTKLRALGWYVPGQEHANDAARHLLVYLVQSQSEVGRELLRRVTAAAESALPSYPSGM